MTNGHYFVEVHTVDGQGGETVVTEEVTVFAVGSDGVGTVMAQPNVLKGVTQTTFTSDSVLGLILQVRLYSIAGEKVSYNLENSGINQTTIDVSGLASGLYLAVVDAIDSHGWKIGQKIVKLAIVH